MKLNETKSYFFEKSNKIDKPLASLKCFCTVDIFQDPPQKISHVGSLTPYGVNFMNESSEIIQTRHGWKAGYLGIFELSPYWREQKKLCLRLCYGLNSGHIIRENVLREEVM